jgi:hypothetical protein
MFKCTPLDTFQSCTTPSSDPDAKTVLSVEKASDKTRAECPESWCSGIFSWTPQIFTVKSSELDASNLLSGEMTTGLELLPWNFCTQMPSAVSQRFNCLSIEADASSRPSHEKHSDATPKLCPRNIALHLQLAVSYNSISPLSDERFAHISIFGEMAIIPVRWNSGPGVEAPGTSCPGAPQSSTSGSRDTSAGV